MQFDIVWHDLGSRIEPCVSGCEVAGEMLVEMLARYNNFLYSMPDS